MTIQQALDALDSTQYNTMSQTDKIRFLSELDQTVADFMSGFTPKPVAFAGYDDTTDPATVLLLPQPHDRAYIYWLQAQVDFHNREYNHFNNSSAMFQAAYDDFQRSYLRGNPPNESGEFH